MVSEPVYEYVRGQGWTVISNQTYDFGTRHGNIIRLQVRKPNVGERFTYCWSNSRSYVKDGFVILEHVAGNVKEYGVEYYPRFVELNHEIIKPYTDEDGEVINPIWIVIEPILV